MKITYKYPVFRNRLHKIAAFSVLVVGITTSAFSEVTYNPDKNTWSGSGTYSETINVSGDTIFNCSAGNITLTGPITGTGTIRHTGPANTLLLKSDLSGFTGTISNEINRWIEMYSVAGNSTTSGDTSMWDMSHISFTASHTQGFALASQIDVPTAIFAFGDMSTSNASTTIQSSSKSSTVTSTNAKSLIICEVGALNKNSTYAGKFEITANTLSALIKSALENGH
ncbi:MAG: hypothetical protein Q4C70_00630 [Planctomycetia bacterium]|nr:hypothetical protein [Planctomycetia bacterium]